jgi:hypothetical protein
MPPGSKILTPNAAACAEGKSLQLGDYFSGLLNVGSRHGGHRHLLDPINKT